MSKKRENIDEPQAPKPGLPPPPVHVPVEAEAPVRIATERPGFFRGARIK